ncbi:MAG: chemotaxis protein CheW [Candidatus Calescibacterium sp.]|nr:chemotaxis protein CheW [Candidatus Calescibacterium sp.]MCX7734882.1 chemotaxis protein CheW [bacterium]MDW8086573.1 chemotaxis protein CheW [Candidatus Calescibacterium sp.]
MERALGSGTDYSGDISTKIICMKIVGETYGVEIDYVEELIRITDENISFSSSIPHVRGVISLRGEVVPLLDLSVMFGLKKKDIDNEVVGKKGVVVRVGEGKGLFCIIADDIFILTDVSKIAISDSPKVGIKYVEMIKGIVRDEKTQENMIIVLDPMKILRKHRELSGIKTREESY